MEGPGANVARERTRVNRGNGRLSAEGARASRQRETQVGREAGTGRVVRGSGREWSEGEARRAVGVSSEAAAASRTPGVSSEGAAASLASEKRARRWRVW